MSRNLRARLQRLERLESQQAEGPPRFAPVPPRFWDVLCGAVPLAEAHPETRRLVAALYRPYRPKGPDPVEVQLQQLEARAAAAANGPRGQLSEPPGLG